MWGANGSGQLGLGPGAGKASLVPQSVSSAVWRSVAVGLRHTVAVRADSTLWAWGDNREGQLGDGTYVPRTTPMQIGRHHDWVRVGAGERHTLAIRGNGTLWAWGENAMAQLGIGTQYSPGVPMPTQVGNATSWVSVAGGFGHSVGLQRDGSLWTWGWGYVSDWTRLDTYYSRTPQRVVTGQSWASVASGASKVLAVGTDGTLWGWGDNVTGALGTPSYTLEPLLIQAGASLQLDRFGVYPNPAHGQVTIRSPGCSAPLLLFDLTGRQVRSLPACSTTLDVQGLATGVYLLRQGTAVTRLAVE